MAEEKDPGRAYVLVAYPYEVDEMTHAIIGPFARVTDADGEARRLGIGSWCVRPLHEPKPAKASPDA